MRQLIVAMAMVLVACGGVEHGPLDYLWTLSMDNGRSAAVDMVVAGDNLRGTLAIGNDHMPFLSGHGDNDGGSFTTTEASDGLTYYVLTFNLNADQSLSGVLCTHRHGEVASAPDCSAFVGAHH